MHKDLQKQLDVVKQYLPPDDPRFVEIEKKLKELSKHPKKDWVKVVLDENVKSNTNRG